MKQKSATFHTQYFVSILKTFPHLHVVTRRTEPLEQKNGERRHVDRHDQHQDPRRRVERLWMKDDLDRDDGIRDWTIS